MSTPSLHQWKFKDIISAKLYHWLVAPWVHKVLFLLSFVSPVACNLTKKHTVTMDRKL